MGKKVLQSFGDFLSSIALHILLKLLILSVILTLVHVTVAPKWINESVE